MRTTYALPGELTIYSVGEVRQALLDWLDGAPAGAALGVNAEQVLDVDGAGVQLLCSLGALLDRQGRGWRIENASDTLARAFETLGLHDWYAALAAQTDSGDEPRAADLPQAQDPLQAPARQPVEESPQSLPIDDLGAGTQGAADDPIGLCLPAAEAAPLTAA
ncbi:MAG: hypothetical protein RIQ60_868 [Pseudomonadota bacterium]|jgi:anti-anti-sigma regulatory factor